MNTRSVMLAATAGFALGCLVTVGWVQAGPSLLRAHTDVEQTEAQMLSMCQLHVAPRMARLLQCNLAIVPIDQHGLSNSSVGTDAWGTPVRLIAISAGEAVLVSAGEDGRWASIGRGTCSGDDILLRVSLADGEWQCSDPVQCDDAGRE